MDIDTGAKKIKSIVNQLLKNQGIVLVGIAGGTSSGKTYLARKLNYSIISIDDYYKGRNNMVNDNYDHPHALELNLLKKHLLLLKQNKSIKKPIYDFTTHLRKGYETFRPSKVIVVEGIFALSNIFNAIFDVKVFVDAPRKTRLARRIERDERERGRTSNSVIEMFNSTVEPMHIKYVLPAKEHADIVIRN